jgi:hypothetical protein
MNWTAEGTASGYRVYRGTQAGLINLLGSGTDFCTRYENTVNSLDITADNASGQTPRCFFYLIVAYNGGGEGPAGNATAGARQVNTTGACP